MRKRYEKLLSETKMAVQQYNSGLVGPKNLHIRFFGYDIFLDILGKDNHKICAIAGGIDSGRVLTSVDVRTVLWTTATTKY